jgi:hypothetical protein
MSQFSNNFPRALQAVNTALPGISRPVRQMVLAIGWFESNYGVTSDWLMPDGSPSNNWGAVIAVGNQNYIIHGDTDRIGRPATQRFAAFNTPEEGVLNFWRAWAKPDTLAAAQQGSSQGVATAMYRHSYYSGASGDDATRIWGYASAIYNWSANVASALGESLAVQPPSAKPGGRIATSFPIIRLALGGALGYFLAKRYGKKG